MEQTRKCSGFNNLKKTSLVLGLAFSLMAPQAVYADVVETASMNVAQQTDNVKGHVVDENGEPLIGVTVQVKGGQAAAITDFDGNFSLKAPAKAVLEFTYVGYVTQTVAAGSNLVVKMVPDAVGLEDVVVIGYGTMKKRDLTGSIASIKSDDIVRVPTSNVMEAIQGQVAGFDITRSTGEVGSGVHLTLRGNRSINGSNEPLFIIDGMEGSYDELNPSDIASIEVLKDASSTAIYGAAGANGVVIITTKEAKKDKFSINLDAYVGFNTITSFPEVRTGQDYIDFRRIAQKNGGTYADDNGLFPSYMADYVKNGNWIDWFDEATQTGITQNYNLSTTYATDKMKSYMSVNYYDIKGIVKGDELKRYSARAKYDFMPNKVVKYGMNIYALYGKNDKRSSRIWNRILCTAPVGKVYNEDGSINKYPLGETTVLNPIADSQDGVYANDIKTLSVTPQAYVELTPLKGLSFKSTLGGYFQYRKTSRFYGKDSYNQMEYGTVYAEIPNTLNYNYKWDNVLTYAFDINDHNFVVTGVTEWAKNRMESVSARANNFDSNDYLYHNLGAATGTPTVASDYIQTQKMSYAMRLNYSYLGKYLFSASGRWDGSSMLAAGNKWDFFPSVAAGWRISDEAFMQNVEAVSNLKLRASYGVTGNAGASAYATLDFSRTGQFGMQDVPTYFSGYNSTVANPSLSWEKTYMWDFGLDLGLLKDRISLTLDWYSAQTKDVLYQVSLPYMAGGFGSAPFNTWGNVGETKNTGIELAVTSRNIVNKDFTWTTTLTFAKNNEKVVATTQENPLQFGDYYLIPGEAMHTYYNYKYAGIWGTAEAEEAAKYSQKPGQVHIAEVPDENGEVNYKLDANDYQIIGNADPKWTGSLFNSFTYKGFDLSFLLVARWDWTINYGITGWYRTDGINPTPKVCDYWTEDNQGARYPAPTTAISNGQDPYQHLANYFDGSYIKVKTISLGYTFNKKLLKQFGVEGLRVYGTASNPFVFAKSKYLKNYDPEKGGDDDDAPLSKQFVFGINLTF